VCTAEIGEPLISGQRRTAFMGQVWVQCHSATSSFTVSSIALRQPTPWCEIEEEGGTLGEFPTYLP
jgi:hypothetical protein